MSEEKKRRRVQHWNTRRVTDFYPQYGEGRDAVTAVSAVRGTQFQRVYARYNLSTTETRDSGMGPMFDETRYGYPQPIHAKKQNSPQETENYWEKFKRKKKKIRINFNT